MENIDKIKQGDLYSLLAICSDEELAPLVEIITGCITNELDIDELYKKHKPNHCKYYKKIGDEVRLFGSDSFASVTRGGEGVDYSEVVTDVCNRLDIPCKGDDLLRKERKLISLYNLEKSSIKSSISVGRALSFVAAGLLSKMNPLGWIYSVKNLSSPAFRVTIPCVLHIAMLRVEIIKKYNLSLMEIKSCNKAGRNFILSDNENKDVLSFSEVFDREILEPIDISKSEINNLNSLLQIFPSLATASNVKSKRYMEVFINGSLAKAKDGNGFRGWSKGAGSKIEEQARLFEPNELSKLVSFNAVYNVVSAVVAQQHLADISLKLHNIESLLDSIKIFQNNERESEIKGAILYFQQVATPVFNGCLMDSILNQIESKECAFLGIQVHLLKDIERLGLAGNLKDGGKFGIDGLVKSIDEYQNEFHDLCLQLILCIRARACGWQLLTFYPVDDSLLDKRYKEIDDVVNLLGDPSFFMKINENMMSNIRRLSAIFSSESQQKEKRIYLLDKYDDSISKLELAINDVKREMIIAKSLYENKKENKSNFILGIENGEVTDVSPSLRN